MNTDTHTETHYNAQIITQLTNMLLLFQEKERINSILMEYQRKKAVSIMHIIIPPSTVTHSAFSPCFSSVTIVSVPVLQKKLGENCCCF